MAHTPPNPEQAAKAKRLAAALRANLKKRKAQLRGRDDAALAEQDRMTAATPKRHNSGAKDGQDTPS
ncbi:MAG: hypothetical protein ACRCTD_06900 [Beijerinckiaceae bacterium]